MPKILLKVGREACGKLAFIVFAAVNAAAVAAGKGMFQSDSATSTHGMRVREATKCVL